MREALFPMKRESLPLSHEETTIQYSVANCRGQEYQIESIAFACGKHGFWNFVKRSGDTRKNLAALARQLQNNPA